MARQVRETVWGAGKRLPDGLIEAYPNRELDENRAKATQRVEPRLPINLQRLLRLFLPVAGMLGLDLFQPRRQLPHLFGVLGLFDGQREHQDPDEDGEDDDTQPNIIEKDVVQQHQAVDHRPEDNFYPGVN